MVRFAERRDVELINVGTWDVSSGRWKCGPDDLSAAVAAQSCPAIRRPYLKLGHVDPRFDGEPAIGWVQNLRTTNSGQTLAGDFTDIPVWLNDVMASAFPDRSVEARYNVRCSLGHTHPFVLDGLALLGVTAPGVTTLRSLRDIPALYGITASSDQPAANAITFIVRASQATPAASPAAAPRSSAVSKPRIYDRPRGAGEQSIGWAISTGRIKASEAPYWRDQGVIADRVLPRLAAGSAVALTPAGALSTVVHATRPTPDGVDPAWYALNPALDSLRATNAATVQAAAQVDPNPPTLFQSGDLPPFTSSGLDPAELVKVPWCARHAVAASTDLNDARDLIAYYSGPDGLAAAAAETQRHVGNRDYATRLWEWIGAGETAAASKAQEAETLTQASVRAAGRLFADPDGGTGDITFVDDSDDSGSALLSMDAWARQLGVDPKELTEQ